MKTLNQEPKTAGCALLLPTGETKNCWMCFLAKAFRLNRCKTSGWVPETLQNNGFQAHKCYCSPEIGKSQGQ
eukprot:3682481-Amphidinium_carterae.1